MAMSTDLSPGIRIESDDNTDRMVNMLPDWISTAHVEETYGLSLSTTGPCDGGCGFRQVFGIPSALCQLVTSSRLVIAGIKVSRGFLW
jgi:hypothetical protein